MLRQLEVVLKLSDRGEPNKPPLRNIAKIGYLKLPNDGISIIQ